MRRLLVICAVVYLTVVVASVGLIEWRNRPTPPTPAKKELGANMNAPDDWKAMPDTNVPARPSGLWTLADEYVRGPALIRFTTDPAIKWNYATRSDCTADGDMASMISSQAAIMPGAPVGALIAKIGGSSAGQSDGRLFLVGSFAIIEIDANTRGPLYLTINDEASGMDNNSGNLTVSIGIKVEKLASNPPPPSGAPAKS